MRVENSRAATAATARLKAHVEINHSGRQRSTRIDDILAALILGLAVRHHTGSERALVADRIDRLLRRKIELGLVGGVRDGG